jgi:hypothetical protein
VYEIGAPSHGPVATMHNPDIDAENRTWNLTSILMAAVPRFKKEVNSLMQKHSQSEFHIAEGVIVSDALLNIARKKK